MMDLYGGCMFCSNAVDCQIAGKPDEDCPVEAYEKAKADLKQVVMETKLFKALEAVLEKLLLR